MGTVTARRDIPGGSVPEVLSDIFRRVIGGDWRMEIPFWSRVAGTFGSRGLGLVIGLATSVVTARVLGAEGLGAYAVMMTLGAMGAQFGNLGIPSATTHYAAGERDALPGLLGAASITAVGIGGVVAAGIVGILALVPGLRPLEEMPLLVLAAAWIPAGLALTLSRSVLLGLGRIRAYNLVELGQGALALGGMLALWWAGRAGIVAFFLTSLGALLAGVAVAGILLVREAGGRITLPGRVLVKRVAGYGFRAYLATLFSFLVLSFDLFMVSAILGEGDAGRYSISARMAGWVYELPAALGAILFATVSGMSGGRWAFTRKIAVRTAAGLVPVVGVAGLVASPLVGLIYGPEYAPAVLPFLWLLPGIYLLGVNTVFMNHFAGIGMPWVAVLAPGAAATTNIVLNLVLLPELGIVGAAMASSVAYAVMLGASLAYLGWRQPGRRREVGP